MILAGDELEFAISQYLDGQLSASDAGVLEERFATDPAARELLREYEQVQGTLRSAPKLPDLDWAALSRETVRVCAANQDLSRQYPKLGWGLAWLTRRPLDVVGNHRIGFFAPLALAASLAIVGGVSLIITHSRSTSIAAPAAGPVIAQVSGPKVEAPTGTVVADVSIGAAPTVAANSYRNTDDVVDRPSIVLINRADDPTPDSDSLY